MKVEADPYPVYNYYPEYSVPEMPDYTEDVGNNEEILENLFE